ncbi:MAG: multicopper oxidase domain-containing protein [Bryobacterales bacterium]
MTKFAQMFLVGILALLGAGYASAQQEPDLSRGERIYKSLCTQCHGSTGNGWGINAPHMQVKPRNHTDYDEMISRTDANLIKVVTKGGVAINKSVLMPSWGNNLSDDDIKEVVTYLRKLCCSDEAAALAAKRAAEAGPMTKMSQAPPSVRPQVELGERFEPEPPGATPSIPLPTQRIDPSAPFHHFEMTIEELAIPAAPEFVTKVWGFNGQVPGPLIHVGEGDELVVNVTNNTTLSHTVHWHGTYQTNSWKSDGVPGITQKPIEPGEAFQYHFIASKPGSLWYHCHVNVPEHVGTRGMWGPMVVDPKEPIPIESEVTKEAILMFSGWDSDVAMELGEGGHPRDLPNYFSINARAFPLSHVLRVKTGDVLRLRLMAASIEVAFHLHGHDMLVTHKDGLPLDTPYWADVVDVPIGARIDVIVRADNPGRWLSHDHIEQHTSNNGVMPGGAVFLLEYEDLEKSDDEWYMFKDAKPDPDFYYSEKLKLPHGLHEAPVHRGYRFEDDEAAEDEKAP